MTRDAGLNPVYRPLAAVAFPRVSKFYKACRYPAKPGRHDSVHVLVNGEGGDAAEIVAALRLLPPVEVAGQFWCCLRSLVVHPQLRRRGLAGQLLRQALAPQQAQQGLISASPRIYCFALQGTEPLYAAAGFQPLAPADAPAFLNAAYSRYCRQGRKITAMLRIPEGDQNV